MVAAVPRRIHAVVPLKELKDGKCRLAGMLSPAQRMDLIRAMASHVLSVLSDIAEIDSVSLLTNEKSRISLGCARLCDPGPNLNAAVAHAGRMIESIGGDAMLVVAADLPLVGATDICCMIDAARSHAIVIAADSKNMGTNALLISPPASFIPSYGKGSLRAHLDTAHRERRSVRVLSRPGLACDIDEPGDLSQLVGFTHLKMVG